MDSRGTVTRRIILVQQAMIRNNPEIITVGRVRRILRRNPTHLEPGGKILEPAPETDEEPV